MFGLFNSEKTKSPVHEVARGIFNVYIASNDFKNYSFFDFHERGRDFNQILTNRYFSKIKIYRRAIVIFCLLEASKKDKSFQSVLHVFEALVFPPTEEEGREILAETTGAMDSLANLIRDSEKGMSWAKVWLNQIGILEDNPARLLMLSLAVLEDVDILRKTIARIQPI